MNDRDLIQNRWSSTKFDAARSEYVADGKQLTAKFSCTGRAWTATLVWKKGYSGIASLTTLDDAAMKSSLLRLDSSVRFIGQVNHNVVPVESLADKQAEMLEMLRTDPTTSQKAYESACKMYKQKPKPRNAPAETRSNQNGPVLSAADQRTLEAMRVDLTVGTRAYRNACAKFGVQPQPRPTQAATPTSQALVPFHVQGQAYGEFMQAHGELFTGFFAEGNAAIIAQWMQDEHRQCDAASVAQCYAECLAAGYFRDARTLSRDLNGSLRIVRPYNHAELVATRRRQTVDAVNAPPAYLSDVERDAWLAVRQKYPTLSVRSAGFQQCARDTLLLWAKQHVLESQPELGSANKKGELSVAINKTLNAWAKISNPGMNRRVNEKGQEILWLG